jgi:peptidylprolyl isomerase
MKLLLWSLLSVALLSGAGASLAGDRAAIPPAERDVHAQLAARLPLAQAIAAAQEETGGLAREARFGEDGNVTVRTFSETTQVEVVVDGARGSVLSKRICARFPGAPCEGPWTELPSGLKYFELTVGKGPKPPGRSSTVKVHYTGWLNDGTKFYSSFDRGQPDTFPLDQVIAGWTEGVGSMQVGGKRKLVIPFELAYGADGRPPVIPPRATLIFDIELLEIVE